MYRVCTWPKPWSAKMPLWCTASGVLPDLAIPTFQDLLHNPTQLSVATCACLVVFCLCRFVWFGFCFLFWFVCCCCLIWGLCFETGSCSVAKASLRHEPPWPSTCSYLHVLVKMRSFWVFSSSVPAFEVLGGYHIEWCSNYAERQEVLLGNVMSKRHWGLLETFYEVCGK